MVPEAITPAVPSSPWRASRLRARISNSISRLDWPSATPPTRAATKPKKPLTSAMNPTSSVPASIPGESVRKAMPNAAIATSSRIQRNTIAIPSGDWLEVSHSARTPSLRHCGMRHRGAPGS